MDPLDHRAKRRKPNPEAKAAIEEMETEELEVVTASMKRPISPPMSRRRRSVTPEVETPRVLARHASLKQPPTLGEAIVEVQQDDETNDLLAEVPREQEGVDEDQGVTNTPVFGSVTQGLQQQHQDGSPEGSRKYIPSPIQLTRIQDLPMESNLDTVGLEDILGDVMIRECWNFNFLFDIDWVM
jgi:tyrosyl-DNA phosphodiesterase-1